MISSLFCFHEILLEDNTNYMVVYSSNLKVLPKRPIAIKYFLYGEGDNSDLILSLTHGKLFKFLHIPLFIIDCV